MSCRDAKVRKVSLEEFLSFHWKLKQNCRFFRTFPGKPRTRFSLEAILSRTKLSKKTKIGDGSETPGTSVPNKFQSNPVCSYPPTKFSNFVIFQRLSTSRHFLMNISWSNLIYVKSHIFAGTYITFLKGYDAGFPKKSKLSINFCFEILDR